MMNSAGASGTLGAESGSGKTEQMMWVAAELCSTAGKYGPACPTLSRSTIPAPVGVPGFPDQGKG